MAVQQISTIKPDPEDLVTQLQTQLATKASWKDLLTTSVGQTLLEFVAAVGANDQYAIERSFKEMFPQTARLDSSIYAATRFLGVRLKRKSPAHLKANFTNSSGAPVTIPAFTQFSISGQSIFNRTSITVPASSTLNDVYLYEGQLRYSSFTATGNAFQTVISSETGFVISDQDVLVKLNTVEIERVTDGLWNYKLQSSPTTQNITPGDGLVIPLTFTNILPDSVVVPGFTVVTTVMTSSTDVLVDYVAGTLTFYPSGVVTTPVLASYDYLLFNLYHMWQDMTTADGSLQVQFGNTLYGTNPLAGDTIELTYAVTKGIEGNDASLSGVKITYSSQPAYISVVSGAGGLTGAENEIATSLYRTLAPQLFSAQERAVTQQDYDSIALTYTGWPLADAKFQGQRDLDTGDNTYMNLCKIWLLYEGASMTNTDFTNFTTWLTDRSMYALRFFYDQTLAVYPVGPTAYGVARPVPIDFTIVADVSCRGHADLVQVKAEIERAIDAYCAIQRGTISKDVYISDIMNTIKYANDSIDFVNLTSPTTNILTNAQSIQLAVAPLAGGTLPLGDHDYKVTAVFGATLYPGASETVMKTGVNITLTGANASVVLTWKQLTGALQYKIYRNTMSGHGLLATVGATVFTYTDTGAITPTTAPPSFDISGLRYPRLTSKSITMRYTYRP